MDGDLTKEQIAEIAEELFQGRKIEAIKRCREFTGMDLAGSKSFVESLGADLREKFPEKFTHAERSGCGSAAIVMISAAGLVVHAIRQLG